MKDNSDIPLPVEQLRSRVMVYAIMNDALQQYEQVTKGYVQLVTDEGLSLEYHYLEVKDENTKEVTMRSSVNKQSNFGKQKGTIISWTDDEQAEYHELALSFQTEQECDIFWRSICEKIGKSYLEINGEEKLQIPTVNNMKQLLQKAKNSVDLVDYNLVHSDAIFEGLRSVYKTYKQAKDQMGCLTVLRFINTVFSLSYSTAAIQSFLTGENFSMLLELQSLKKQIDFVAAYQQSIGSHLKNRFDLPAQIFRVVELSHRATFYRQNVLNLAEEAKLQSIMFMICKQTQVKTMGFINRSSMIDRIIDYQNKEQHQQADPLSQNEQASDQVRRALVADKLHFILECLVMYGQMTSEQVRNNFKESIYSSKLMSFLKKQIESDRLDNSSQALQALFYIANIDTQRFFVDLIQNYKRSSSDNLWKTLTKTYTTTHKLTGSILSLIEALIPIFNKKPEHFNFFIGTFFFTVIQLSADTRSIIGLINVIFLNVQNPKALMSEIVKSKLLDKIANEYRTGSNLKRKYEELQILKLLKSIIVELDQKKQHKMIEIERSCIESGFFECCLMIYFKHSQRYNILSSSMLENLRLIEKMDYSLFDIYLIKEHSETEYLTEFIPQLKQKHIAYINKKTDNQNAEKYKELDQVAHDNLLDNEFQDDYLMNQNQQFDIKDDPTRQSLHVQKAPPLDDESLESLKRMRNEIVVDDQEEMEAQKRSNLRKLNKKGPQNSEETSMFSFDLPDMEELQCSQELRQS